MSKDNENRMERTENVELTVLCLIQDGDWILLQNRLYQGLKMPGSITNIGGEYGMRIEKRLYTAAEVIVIIKDKWKEKVAKQDCFIAHMMIGFRSRNYGAERHGYIRG